MSFTKEELEAFKETKGEGFFIFRSKRETELIEKDKENERLRLENENMKLRIEGLKLHLESKKQSKMPMVRG